MKKITDFLSKPVLSLLESSIEGYVKNVVFDSTFKKMKYLVIFEDNEFQEEKILDVSKIYSFGDNAIIVKNNLALVLKQTEILEIENHINCKVYTSAGQFVGIIADVELNDRNYVENVVLTNEQRLLPSQFFNFGQDVFFINTATKTVKLSQLKHKTVPAITETSSINSLVEIQETVQSNEIESTKKYVFTKNSIPKKITTSNSDFLIGRKTTKTIYSSNNEVIVKKNIVITKKIIEQASIFNKLRELAIYSA